jgi:hypothetical protein
MCGRRLVGHDPAHLLSRKGIAVIAFIMPLWCLRRAIAIVSARHRPHERSIPEPSDILPPPVSILARDAGKSIELRPSGLLASSTGASSTGRPSVPEPLE